MSIKSKIKATSTVGELDYLRLEIVKNMINGRGLQFEEIQDAFRKQKSKLNRIPWGKRGSEWDIRRPAVGVLK